MKFVEDRRFTGAIQAKDQNAIFLLTPELLEQLREQDAHLFLMDSC